MNKTHLTWGLMALLTSAWAGADDSPNANRHAPIGVMGDHTHQQGEFMFSYRFMDMGMSGMVSGTDHLSTAEVLDDFMMSPVRMDMKMHMLGFMYAPTDRLTLMAMLNHSEKDMVIQNRMGMRFRTHSSGTADSKIGALYRLKNWGHNQLHMNFNVSVPTGSINQRDNTPMAENMLLPYGMQNSSGTYDYQLGLTWNQYHEGHAWGAQLMSTIRTGENDAGYRLGHEHALTIWGSKNLSDAWSLSGRLSVKNKQSIKGSDARLQMMAMMTPAANADFTGGDWLDAAIGLNYLVISEGWFDGHRFAFEYSSNISQDVAGIQMDQGDMWTLGWQKAF